MLGTYGGDPAAATFYAGPLAITGLAVLALWLYAPIASWVAASQQSSSGNRRRAAPLSR